MANERNRIGVAALVVWSAVVVVGLLTDVVPDPAASRRPLPPPAEPPQTKIPAGTPSGERQRRPLPQPAASDATYDFEIKDVRKGFSGTAFAINGTGGWMSARHTVEGCTEIHVTTGRSVHKGVVTFVHPSADLAVVTTTSSGVPVPVWTLRPDIGQDGYGFGFPLAKLGGVHSKLMGRERRNMKGHASGVMPVLVWAEVERYPVDIEALGGLSGSPTFDEFGRVVGIHIAGTPRRGRLVTVAPEVLESVRQTTGAIPQPATLSAVRELTAESPSLKAISEALFRQGRLGWLKCFGPAETAAP